MEQFECDRCGAMFEPEMRCDATFAFHDKKNSPVLEHQICANCAGLIVRTFNFTVHRQTMEKRSAILSARQNAGA